MTAEPRVAQEPTLRQRPASPADDGRKVLVSGAGPAMAPLLALASRSFRTFAGRHGYEVQLHDLDDHHDRSRPAVRHAKWRKVQLIRRALRSADVVLWIDADAVICRFDRDIAAELTGSAFQGLVLERFADRVNPNTGVWLLRRDPRSLRFLDAVDEMGQLPHSWADQATVCRLLGWELGDHHGRGAAPRHGSVHLAGTAWLPDVWNRVGAGDRTRIRHVAGRPLAERRAVMAAIVGELDATGQLDR